MITNSFEMTVVEARELLQRYPWFDIPALVLHGEGRPLPPRLDVLARYRPSLLSGLKAFPAPEPQQSDTCRNQCNAERPSENTIAIIDDFIRSGEHRIVANEQTPDSLPLADDVQLPDELLTEELAGIYMQQGMTERAVEIYRRLSLLNPEKSVYFAELIEKTADTAAGNEAITETDITKKQ